MAVVWRAAMAFAVHVCAMWHVVGGVWVAPGGQQPPPPGGWQPPRKHIGGFAVQQTHHCSSNRTHPDPRPSNLSLSPKLYTPNPKP
jgi:hypothetical protein